MGSKKSRLGNFLMPILTGTIMASGIYDFANSQTQNPIDTLSVVVREIKCNFCNGLGYISCRNCGGSGSIEIKGHKVKTCPDCRGEGYRFGRGDMRCYRCSGTGRIYEDYDYYRACSSCGGKGKNDCIPCGTTGYIYREMAKIVYYDDGSTDTLEKTIFQTKAKIMGPPKAGSENMQIVIKDDEEAEEPQIYEIGEWARGKDLEFKVNDAKIKWFYHYDDYSGAEELPFLCVSVSVRSLKENVSYDFKEMILKDEQGEIYHPRTKIFNELNQNLSGSRITFNSPYFEQTRIVPYSVYWRSGRNVQLLPQGSEDLRINLGILPSGLEPRKR